MEHSSAYTVFIRKLVFMNLLINELGLSYEEVSYILDSYVDIIRTYDKELIQKNGIQHYELKRGCLHD